MTWGMVGVGDGVQWGQHRRWAGHVRGVYEGVHMMVEGGGGSEGSRDRRRGESEKRRCRVARMGIGVGDSGGRGRRRSCTVVRRDC